MQMTGQETRQSLEIAADLVTVWRAWTDPEWLCGWLVERADGVVAAGQALAWHWDSLGVTLDLEVLACDAPRRLSLRGAAHGRAPQVQNVSLVEVPGGTRIELTHTGFAPGAAGDDERAGTAAGWHVMLRALAHYLAGGPGRRRECAAALAPVAAPIDVVGELLHDPVRRGGWLTDGAAPELAREGDVFAMRIVGGQAVSGRVIGLAAPLQLALGWDEVDGVFMLRAIQVAGGGGPVLVCAYAWSWSPEGEAWRAGKDALGHAVARLVDAAGGAPGGSA
jgi:uncharacterized protein YndB with AHSA1/START domain